MVFDGMNAKGSPLANRNNRSNKNRRHVLTNDILDDLRWELRLIDKTIAALSRLSTLRSKRAAVKCCDTYKQRAARDMNRPERQFDSLALVRDCERGVCDDGPVYAQPRRVKKLVRARGDSLG